MSIYSEDLVRGKVPPHVVGMVLRTWREDPASGIETLPGISGIDPLTETLRDGEIVVGVSGGLGVGIGHESGFTLLDRTLRAGDIVKRTAEDVQSGVVLSTDVMMKLAHAINGVKYPGWVTMEDVLPVNPAPVGMYVVHQNWLGTIIETFDEIFIQLGDGVITMHAEMGARVQLGDKGVELLPASDATHEINPRASHSDTVIHVQQVALAISWVAISQMLPPQETSNYPRPKQFWAADEFSQLTALPRDAGLSAQLELKLRFRNPHVLESKGVPPTVHTNQTKSLSLEVRTMVVKETKSIAHVQWQDGTTDTVEATKLVPHLVNDSYECWPGDHVLWKYDGVSRHAVVQSVNASQRTALVLFKDNNESTAPELVSVLELDISGPSDDQQALTEDYGVRLGDLVFLHPEGTTNGVEPPRVPVIGEFDHAAMTAGLGVDDDGQLTGWRKEFHDFGHEIAKQRRTLSTEKKSPWYDYQVASARGTGAMVMWFGEVSKLRLDGLIEVLLGDNSRVTVPLNRISKLDVEDDLDVDDDDDDETDYSNEDHEMITDEQENLVVQELLAENSPWLAEDGSEMDDDEDGDDDDDVWEDVNDNLNDPSIHPRMPGAFRDPATHGNPVLDATPPALLGYNRFLATYPQIAPFVRQAPWLEGTPELGIETRSSANAEIEELDIEAPVPSSSSPPPPQTVSDSEWSRFEIQETTPQDHAFLSTKSSQSSKAFATRLQKEYRVLASSLPETILVRAYEDRNDLLRCLIIGPENTPYQDAPFLIDWLLESDFPHSPPKAFFHSWTQGNGRVNPNLYEDGKVCLSILGTWGGDHSESWSPHGSSLLQAFVSIQGLVLVKEPWYCEPGFEKQKGTREGDVNSRLYNEKAYILSQNFVRRALEQPPGGLESEIKFFYFKKRKLFDVLAHAHKLIEGGVGGEEDKDAAVPSLTQGGIISLNRTLPRLRALAEQSA